MNPKYPVYIISKGRWETRLTVKSLEKMKVPYRIVVEPKEYIEYLSVISPLKILLAPENFSELGQGSIPVRNFVWEHSTLEGHKKHWILDDNIRGFYRLNRNVRAYVGSGTIFKCIEDFTDRYENVALSGMNYLMFADDRSYTLPAYRINERIYSCILINNIINYRWRGKYNEDTDLSIRVLKDGWCTILFNAFLANKTTTMTMKGGNTDELYKNDGRKNMAESLQMQHPDIVTITKKYGRFQHQVNYSHFKKNKLIKKPGLIIPDVINNYGMVLSEKMNE